MRLHAGRYYRVTEPIPVGYHDTIPVGALVSTATPPPNVVLPPGTLLYLESLSVMKTGRGRRRYAKFQVGETAIYYLVSVSRSDNGPNAFKERHPLELLAECAE